MTELVCTYCGSNDVKMAGKHGWVECGYCGEYAHGTPADEWEPSEAQQGLIPIPPEYNEN